MSQQIVALLQVRRLDAQVRFEAVPPVRVVRHETPLVVISITFLFSFMHTLLFRVIFHNQFPS